MSKIKKEKSFGCIPVCPQSGEWYLVVKKEDEQASYWSFPKGHQESYEYEFDTALRELREETGLLPDEFVKDEVFIEKYTYDHPDGYQVEKKNTFYLTLFQAKPEPDVGGNEIAEARWVDFQKAKEVLTYQSARDVLKEVHLTLSMNGIL